MWWPYLLLAILGSMVTLCLHELSHCIVIWIEGGKVTKFLPFPHMHDGKFYFGRMEYNIDRELSRAKMTIAPMIKAIAFFSLWATLGIWIHYFLCLAFWEGTDIVNWMQGYIRKSKNDGGQYRQRNAPVA